MTTATNGTDGSSTTGFTLHETAALVGAYRWFEGRCFEDLGRWASSDVGPSTVRVLLEQQARHHGEHVGWLEQVAPRTHDCDPDELVRPGHEHVLTFVDAVAAAEAPGDRLVGATRGFHALATRTYRVHLERSGWASDGPLRRVLRHLLADAAADTEAAEAVLRTLPADLAGAPVRGGALGPLAEAAGSLAGPELVERSSP